MPSRAVIGRRTAPANVRPRCSWTGGVLFRRTSGRPVRADWAKLHDPVYWPYDMLAALKGPAEAGRIDDPWCADALDLLERKQLPTRGWAADAPYARGVGEGQGLELVVSLGPGSGAGRGGANRNGSG